MAAKLLYYKSKALLPDPGFDEPDQEDRLPPELIQQLLEYRKFQMAAEKIRDLADVSSGMFTRESGFSVEIEENSVWLDVSLMDLIQAYSGIIKKYESAAPEEAGFEVEEDVFTVEEKIDMIKKLLENAASFLFEDLFENISAMKKGEIIVTFLAILELVKSGDILVRQKEIFGPIYIFKKSVTVI
jgi:segregation and condensation protein A